MQTHRIPPFIYSLLATLLLLGVSLASADQVLKTFPNGDGKEILDSPVDPDTGGAIIHDEECAKKTMKGERLNNGKVNPEYARCVHDKITKAKKKGSH